MPRSISRSFFVAAAASATAFAALACGCGSRTGLFGLEVEAPDAAIGSVDLDAGFSPPPIDATLPPPPEDSGTEQPDVVLPPIDSSLPAEAATVCADGSTDQTAYLVALDGAFYRFDPDSVTWAQLGTVSCAGETSTPFTMTVTEGDAYVMYDDSSLYRVDLGTLACTKTPFDAESIGFGASLGLASMYQGGKEWLYVYGCIENAAGTGCAPSLARADLTSFALEIVGSVGPVPTFDSLSTLDMKADGYGRLFGLSGNGTLVQLDPTNGDVLAADQTGFITTPDCALLTWNGSIYMFGQSAGDIATYDLATKTLTQLGVVNDAIVGAGSAPCVH